MFVKPILSVYRRAAPPALLFVCTYALPGAQSMSPSIRGAAMNRSLGYALVLLAVDACAVRTTSWKEKPKRIAVTNEKEAGPDFLIQGEYVGSVGGEKLGAHVIARGGGRFDVNLLKGGLAGAGWDGKSKV